jgi:hypothetical protein
MHIGFVTHNAQETAHTQDGRIFQMKNKMKIQEKKGVFLWFYDVLEWTTMRVIVSNELVARFKYWLNLKYDMES